MADYREYSASGATCVSAARGRLEALAAFAQRNAPLWVLTGAGCSTGSGIPDYRDRDGCWKHPQPMMFQEFVRDESARRRYWLRSMTGWPRIRDAVPNTGHHALARLEAAGVVNMVVTQNVDGLHQRAGSRRVLNLHGRLDEVRCLRCGRRSSREALQRRLLELNPASGTIAAAPRPDGDAGVPDEQVAALRLPACDRCGGVIKPDVVFFGEAVPADRVARAGAALDNADGVLVVGSSLMVYSGFRFCRRARERGIPLAAVNRGRTRADDMFEVKVEADCGDILERLAARFDEAGPQPMTPQSGRRIGSRP